MINSDELLDIGVALVRAIRKHIKYSENIPNLYDGYENTSYYMQRATNLSKLNYIVPYSEEIAIQSLKRGVGVCDELSTVICRCETGRGEAEVE